MSSANQPINSAPSARMSPMPVDATIFLIRHAEERETGARRSPAGHAAAIGGHRACGDS